MSFREIVQDGADIIASILERLRRLEGGIAAYPAPDSIASSVDHGALPGLADDDHPQYIRHSTSDAVGDLLVADAIDHFARLAIGTSGQVLTSNGVSAAWAAAAGGSGHTIEENGTPLTARTGLNFVEGLVASDDAGNDETDINADWATTEIVDIGTVEAAGTSTKIPRADHVHVHPSIGSGNLHPEYLTPAEGDTAYVNEVDHTKAAHDALALSHDSLSDVSADDHHAESHSSSVHDTAETGDLAAVAAAAASGSNPEVPFADHVHAHGSGYAGGHSDYPTVPSFGSPGSSIFGEGGADGVAATVPRSDHEHDRRSDFVWQWATVGV